MFAGFLILKVTVGNLSEYANARYCRLAKSFRKISEKSLILRNWASLAFLIKEVNFCEIFRLARVKFCIFIQFIILFIYKICAEYARVLD